MIYNENVTADVKLSETEHNSNLVYFRFNYEKIVKDEKEIWQFDQYVMSEDEYNDVRVGRFSGPWTDALRSIQRGYLYEIADKMVSKYSTDAEDKEKYNAWVQYKHLVRSTQEQENYPTKVVYPDTPE